MSSPINSVAFRELLALSQRIRSVEEAVAQRALANRFAEDTSIRLPDRPPQVTGIQIEEAVTAIRISWSPSPAAALLYYELQFSTSLDFTGVITRRTSETFYDFTGGDPEATYYVRVRAIANAGSGTVAGEYSAVVNGSTGLVETTDLALNAATNPAQKLLQVFDPPTLSTTGTLVAEYGVDDPATIDTVGGVVLPFVTPTVVVQTTIGATTTTCGARYRLLRSDGSGFSPTGDTIISSTNSQFTGTSTITGLGSPDQPGTGTFEYAVQIEVFTNNPLNVISVTPVSIEFELLELRR